MVCSESCVVAQKPLIVAGRATRLKHPAESSADSGNHNTLPGADDGTDCSVIVSASEDAVHWQTWVVLTHAIETLYSGFDFWLSLFCGLFECVRVASQNVEM